jgi:tRNA dimethylallyltransferase
VYESDPAILTPMIRAPVIAVFGPTGVGKTAVAVALGERLRAAGEDPVAISADALQVYAGLERLTGAAGPAEQATLEHRLLAFVPVAETFSAGRYAALAHAEIDGLLEHGRLAIVVGGTGLYLRAALTELDLRPPPAAGAREHWIAELDAHGPEALHARLAARAPEAAARIAATDRQRIVRALELLDDDDASAAAAVSTARAAEGPSQLWTSATRHPTLLVGLTMDRAALYAQIDERVETMIAAGAEQEVRQAAPYASATARKALGFSELLSGDVEAMKRRTRNYARRQLTWMRKLPDVLVLDVTERPPDAVVAEILDAWENPR